MASKIKGLTIEIGGDTTKLGEALENVQKKSKSLSGELGQINRLLKMDPGNTDLLAQKQKVLADAIENTAEKLKTLKTAEKQVQKQFERGEVSEEQVRELKREIIATEKKMDGYKNAAEETERAIRGLGEESEKTEKASHKLGQTLATAAKTGFAAITAVATAAVTGLVVAAESTREYRTEMGKLDASFAAAGKSSKTATAAYKTLYGVIGETDQSVEAAQQIALLAKSEEDVAKWSDLCAGVVGKFGDALQPETFYESANETLKLGEATGAFTQMLEGTGMNVEAFNKKLAACKTTEEKQAYMLDVTQRALGTAGLAYKQNNAEIIRANQANDEWMRSLSGVGGAIEPIITDIKLMGASLLSDAVPGIKQLAAAFRGMMNGEEGASGNFANAISSLVTSLVSKINEALPTLAQTGFTIIKTLATSLIQQIPTLLSTGWQIVTQLAAGIASQVPTMLAKGRELLLNLSTGIKNALPDLISKGLDIIMGLAQSLYDYAPTLISTGFEVLSNLVSGIMSSLPTLIAKVPTIISTIANTLNDNMPTILKKGVQLIWQIVKGIISAIPTLIANIPKIISAIVDVWEAFNWLSLGKKAITLLKNGITAMMGAVKSAGKGIMEACSGALKSLPSKLLQLGKSAVSGLGNALRAGWTNVKTGASVIFNGIVNFFKGLPSKMLSIGKDLVKGLWNGISDMTGWVIGKIQGFGESVLSGIKNFFGIESPSRVFRDEVGKMLAVGMADGLDKNASAPIKAMQRLSAGVLDAAATDVGGLSFERNLARTHRVGSGYGATAAVADNTALLSKLEDIYQRLSRLQVIMDTGATVGALVDPMDAALGNKQVLHARGV